MFGVVLDPGSYIGNVWSLAIPEGLKEVLWKEMNGAQVLGHRYFGTGLVKSDMGRFCACEEEMSLRHILLGCSAYVLQNLLDELTNALRKVSPDSAFKTLHPEEWGHSPWYPLLALKAIEESALPIRKGRKVLLKKMKKTRRHREWLIGNYYWALWKWRMKEIHDDRFRFVPLMCVGALRDILLTPLPDHLQETSEGNMVADKTTVETTKSRPVNLGGGPSLLPPPISCLLRDEAEKRLSSKGKSILRAIAAQPPPRAASSLTGRESALRALTDSAYT